jgi:hypothetical protein
MAATNEYTLSLTDLERTELLKILEAAFGETRVELRRTRTPDYHDEVAREESMLRGLVEKVRQLKP